MRSAEASTSSTISGMAGASPASSKVAWFMAWP